MGGNGDTYRVPKLLLGPVLFLVFMAVVFIYKLLARENYSFATPLRELRTWGPPLNISVGIIEYKNPETLANTLTSYKRQSFLDNFREKFLYIQSLELNNMRQRQRELARENGLTVMGDGQNSQVAMALRRLIKASSSKYFLLLEKDFELVEGGITARAQLEDAIQMLEDGTADVVRLRSRDKPGDPNWGHILFHGQEETVFTRQPNLLCNLYTFIPNPDERWPLYVKKCGPRNEYYCSESQYCNWTNNPVLFKRSWWFENMDKWVDGPKLLDTNHNFEQIMNSYPDAWNARKYKIASGKGLFRHNEIDG